MTDSRTGGIPHQHIGDPAGPAVPHSPVPMTSAGPIGNGVHLGDNGHRGDFGEQFVRMLAAAANLDAARRERDRVGVDWQLGHPGRSGTRRYPAIEAQVKCTSPPSGDDGDIHYPLKVKNYNWLAGREYQVPRFLFLVLAPSDASTWTDATHDRLLLKHAAYWVCLHDLDPLMDRPATSTRTVLVPRANLLTVGSLHRLFDEDYRDMLVAS